MTIKPHYLFTCCLILLACFMVNPALGDDQRDEVIAQWVADQFGLTQAFEMPTRYYLDKTALGLAFEVGNKKSYYRWRVEYGEDKANKILEEYLNNVVGLFNEKTEIIYVGNFIEPCSQQAIFAHEMVHYFQHLTEGIISPDSYGPDLQRLRREMQAYNIEEKYRNTFCQENKNDAPAPGGVTAQK